MIKNALVAEHVRLGAAMTEQLGWEISTNYGNLTKEYQAVRTNVGIIDLSYRGRIEVSGKNRVQFLQGLVSNDVKTLQPGNGVYAAFLNITGRILSDCFIYAREDSILIDTPPAARERVYLNLDKFSPAGDFNVTDFTEATSLLTIQGPTAQRILASAGAGAVINLKELQLTETEINGRKLIVLKNSRTGETGFDLFMSNENTLPVFEALLSAGAEPVGLDAYNVLRLEAGIPEYSIDMDENIIALEAGLERAISYTKGCYLGQETIAKIHHRGKNQTAKKLAGLILEGNILPKAGNKIFNKDNREVGYITSAVESLHLHKPIAFAYLKRDNFTPGTHHQVDINGQKVNAEVVQMPFYHKN